MLKPCKACTWNKAKKAGAYKTAVTHSIIKVRGISSPSIVSMGAEKHSLFIVKDSTNFALSYFLNEKSE